MSYGEKGEKIVVALKYGTTKLTESRIIPRAGRRLNPAGPRERVTHGIYMMSMNRRILREWNSLSHRVDETSSSDSTL